MAFSLWRKNDVGNRYAVSTDTIDAHWSGVYLIKRDEGVWAIEGDTSGSVYATAEDAVKAATNGNERPEHQ